MQQHTNILKNESIPKIFYFFLTALIIFFRWNLIGKSSYDFELFTETWYDHIRFFGGLEAFGYTFANYPPLYLHFISLIALLPIKKIIAIKLINYPFELILAYFSFKIFRLSFSLQKALTGAFLVLLIPTLIMNGSWWGQCDVIYTSMLVASIYYLMTNKNNIAFVFLSIAFCFKIQTIFIALPFCILIFEKPVRAIYLLLMIPTAYLITCLPSILLGRNLLDILQIYRGQAEGHTILDENFPGVYWLFTDVYKPAASWFANAGIIFTFLLLISIALGVSIKNNRPKNQPALILKASFLSVLLIPYFLPFMHDRYFFPADIFSFLFAFHNFKKYFPILFLVILTSLNSYFRFLLGTNFDHYSLLSGLLLLIILFVIIDFLKEQHKERKITIPGFNTQKTVSKQ